LKPPERPLKLLVLVLQLLDQAVELADLIL